MIIFWYCFKSENRSQFSLFSKLCYILIGLSILLFSLGIFSIVILYLHMFTIKSDINNGQTFIPTFMWISNTLFIGFLSLGILLYVSSHIVEKIIAFGVYIVLSFYNGFVFLNSYDVYWHNGAVLVYYTNKTGELYNSILNVLMVILLAIFLIASTFDEKTSKEALYHKVIFLLAILILIITFFIPRTYSYSITNAFSVKLIGYFFYYCFIFVLYNALFSPNKFIEKLKFVTKFKVFDKTTSVFNLFLENYSESGDQMINLSIYSVIILLFLGLLIRFGYLFVPISIEQSKKLGLAIYLFNYNNTNYFIHIIGGLLPIILSMVLIGYLVFKKSNLPLSILKITFIIFVGLILSLLFNWYFHLNVVSYHGSYQFLAGFVIPSIILVIFNLLNPNNMDLIEKGISNKDNLTHILTTLINPIEIYIGTLYSLLLFDVLQPPSQTGQYLLGGGGLSDGLLLLPIGVTAGFYLLISFFMSFSMEFRKKVEILDENSNSTFQ